MSNLEFEGFGDVSAGKVEQAKYLAHLQSHRTVSELRHAERHIDVLIEEADEARLVELATWVVRPEAMRPNLPKGPLPFKEGVAVRIRPSEI